MYGLLYEYELEKPDIITLRPNTNTLEVKRSGKHTHTYTHAFVSWFTLALENPYPVRLFCYGNDRIVLMFVFLF